MAGRTTQLFAALRKEEHLVVLKEVLRRGEVRTNVLSEALALPQPAISKALAELARVGLVRNGGAQRTPYSVTHPREVHELLQAALLIEYAATGDPAVLAEADSLAMHEQRSLGRQQRLRVV